MKYARSTLRAIPVNGLACGIDWAREDHAVAIVDGGGRQVHRSIVEHSSAGLRELLDVLARAGTREVAIERPDGPVVDALLGAGITVVVISPNQLKNLRGRYGSAGNKDDRFDAFVLADVVRTDRRRLAVLRTDRADTQTLRALVRARKDLVGHRIAVANQLRAHLLLVTPAAVGLFTQLDAPVSRAFIADHGTQDTIDALTEDYLAAWLRARRYNKKPAAVLLAQLRSAAP